MSVLLLCNYFCHVHVCPFGPAQQCTRIVLVKILWSICCIVVLLVYMLCIVACLLPLNCLVHKFGVHVKENRTAFSDLNIFI